MLSAPKPTAGDVEFERLVMTPAEVAEALGVDQTELYARLRRDDVPFPAQRYGRRWMIPRAPFMRWLNGDSEQSG
jgi:excisionase family DNA binding protein